MPMLYYTKTTATNVAFVYSVSSQPKFDQHIMVIESIHVIGTKLGNW